MAGSITTIEQIIAHIKNGDNFSLSGGAGSGKTYTLMKVLGYIYSKNQKSRVACITFTKVAVKEIKERAPYKQLWASTIHEFLWDSIKNYQKELKESLVELINMEKQEARTGIKYKGNLSIKEDYFSDKEIEYKDWVQIEDGTISHDEVLRMANYMFGKYPLLCKILKDKYNFILIDEYQDTEKQVVDIFLEYLQNEKSGKSLIGLFGDPMQSIYNKRVGDLEEYIKKGLVKEVIKPDNWRCSIKVIELINKIRDDGIEQEPSGDNEEGSISFLYSNSNIIEGIIEKVKGHAVFEKWEAGDSTKELYLTHRLISEKAGFKNLFEIYDKDRIIEHVQKIKTELKKNHDKESEVEGKTLGEVIDLELARKGRAFQPFIEANPELFLNAKEITFEILRKIYLNKDQLIEGGSERKEDRGDKKDDLIKHLSKIQKCLYLYENNMVYGFLKATEFKIKSIADKGKLKGIMDKLKDTGNKTIGEIIDFADKKGIVKKDDKFNDFIKEKKYVYNRVRQVKYSEFVCLFDYEEGRSPYSTQHGIKGAEFDNVFVVLDNGGWNNYNFEYLFTDNPKKISVNNRTKKIFYVTCSRTKKNLVVFFYEPNDNVIEKAKEWFGEENIYDISK